MIHGHARRGNQSKVYKVLGNMRQRCYNSKNNSYHRYGARGIKICRRWRNFKNFLKDMGEPKLGQVIDRIDNNKGYKPKNCRWVDRKTSTLNSTVPIFLKFNGREKCLSDWAREKKLKNTTLWQRLNRSRWNLKQALTEKVGTRLGVSGKQCFYTFNNMTKNIKQWANYSGIKYQTLHTRITKQNLNIKDALTRPNRYK